LTLFPESTIDLKLSKKGNIAFMSDTSGRANVRMIFTLTLVHFIGDFYASFVNPLLPVFVENFSLSLTQVGLLAGINRFLAFVVQPSVGYLADQYRTRFFVLGGAALSIVFIPLVGLAQSFWVLTVLVCLGSIGSSMFHPTVAGMISTYSGRHFSFSMSIFNTGGTFAFGVGPLFIAYYVANYGLSAAPYTMLIGLPVLFYLFRIFPQPEIFGSKHLGFLGSLKDVLGSVWKPILLIWMLMTLRAFIGQSYMTFLPIWFAQQGLSLVSIGLTVSLFTIAGTLSGLLGGHFADKYGFRPVFYTSFALSGPSLFLLFQLSGAWIYLGIFIGGFFIFATLPLGVAMAQTLAPKGKSMVSSLIMGLAIGTGGMLTPLTGKLADMYSIKTVLVSFSVIPVFALVLIYLIFRSIGRLERKAA
jgi:FSR family fosmidomycin resistance protein-like MFS transporter